MLVVLHIYVSERFGVLSFNPSNLSTSYIPAQMLFTSYIPASPSLYF